MSERPYSIACERNKQPILARLREVFAEPGLILEIGSGTGQHAVHFAEQLPHLRWQPSDIAAHLPGIRLWTEPAGLDNLYAPVELDVTRNPWPIRRADGVFSANTAHIMSWPEVVAMFLGVGRLLESGRCFCLYGPFHYDGQPTSSSNAAFDRDLRRRDPSMGIRDMQALQALATTAGLALRQDHAMPANNRLLVWERCQTADGGAESSAK